MAPLGSETQTKRVWSRRRTRRTRPTDGPVASAVASVMYTSTSMMRLTWAARSGVPLVYQNAGLQMLEHEQRARRGQS